MPSSMFSLRGADGALLTVEPTRQHIIDLANKGLETVIVAGYRDSADGTIDRIGNEVA